MNDTPWVHFTVEETEQGWIVRVKITTGARRYQGPATLYPFPSAETAWQWVRAQFMSDVGIGPSPDEVDGEMRR